MNFLQGESEFPRGSLRKEDVVFWGLRRQDLKGSTTRSLGAKRKKVECVWQKNESTGQCQRKKRGNFSSGKARRIGEGGAS